MMKTILCIALATVIHIKAVRTKDTRVCSQSQIKHFISISFKEDTLKARCKIVKEQSRINLWTVTGKMQGN